MFEDISRIQPVGPSQAPQKTSESEKTERRESVRESSTPAARLIPDLEDRVEISQAGREAAAAKTTAVEEKLPEETTRGISDSWYAAGYIEASKALGNA